MAHAARVVHHVRGRIRLKMSNAKDAPHVLNEIKESLLPLHGVWKVDVNASTGSVVVHYDASVHDDFHDHLAQHGESSGLYSMAPVDAPELTEVDDIARRIQAEAEFLSAHSDTAKAVVGFFGQLDREVRRATSNTLDLKVLLPLGLAIYSFLEVGIEMATPMWVTLGIFSFNSFVSLHAHPPKIATRSDELIVDHPLPEAPPAGSTQPTTIRKRTTVRRKT
jgi:hypothetical protein